jgi:hypothetical protein
MKAMLGMNQCSLFIIVKLKVNREEFRQRPSHIVKTSGLPGECKPPSNQILNNKV